MHSQKTKQPYIRRTEPEKRKLERTKKNSWVEKDLTKSHKKKCFEEKEQKNKRKKEKKKKKKKKRSAVEEDLYTECYEKAPRKLRKMSPLNS